MAGTLTSTAGAQTVRTGVIVSGGLSAETNPYNTISGDGGSSLAATAEVLPRAQIRTEKSTLDLTAGAQFRQFFRRYGLEDNYNGTANLATRPSERLTLNSSASIAYTQGGYGSFGRPGLSSPIGIGFGDTVPDTGGTTDTGGTSGTGDSGGSTTPVPVVPIASGVIDPTIIGLRTRTTTFQGSTGFAGILTPRSQLSGNVYVSGSRFQAPLLNGFNGMGGEMRYSHQLTEFSSIGVIGGVDYVDYLRARQGDTLTKTALLSYDRRFRTGWSFSVGAGASFSTIKQLAGFPDTDFTALSLRGQVCKRGVYDQFCLGGSRSPQPTGIGSVRVTDTLTANYMRRLSARERIAAFGSYTHTGRDRLDALNLPSADFLSGSLRYDNDFAANASFYVNGTVAKTTGSFASQSANLGIAGGLQLRLGELR